MKPHKCPVCEGTKQREKIAREIPPGLVPCEPCNATGIVWEFKAEDFAPATTVQPGITIQPLSTFTWPCLFCGLVVRNGEPHSCPTVTGTVILGGVSETPLGS